MEAFRAAVTQSEEACRVTVAGELDVSTAPILREVLSDVHGDVTIDCDQLAFADSSGIAELLALAYRVDSICLEHPSTQLRRSLEILDLTEILGLEQRSQRARHGTERNRPRLTREPDG
jgi:anti-anti-sigma factor